MRSFSLFLMLALTLHLNADPYEIGTDFESDAFWQSDPVLFVKRHEMSGFEFTSDQRNGADSRLDGAVTYFGIPVFETKVDFAEAGGIGRVELILFAPAGTETFQEFEDEKGKRFRRRVRLNKTIDREDFRKILSTVRKRLNASRPKSPQPTRQATGDTKTFHLTQTWPKTPLPTQTTLTWNFSQDGKNEATFLPGFVRVVVNGPSRLTSVDGAKKQPKGAVAKGARKISDNVLRDPRGDVFIDNVPMVDQGQKGYCAVATAERVLRYYGVEIDEHEVAQAAGTSPEGGTSTRAMKDSIEGIGKRYRLGTVICFGDFDKSNQERIIGLVDEVKAYNKAAKKLKKLPITEDVYIRRDGDTTFYNPAAVDAAMDAEVQKDMKVNGMQKAKYTRFLKDVREQVAKGIPLFWGVRLGVYPEPGLLQVGGWHMRLIVGYNDRKKEILYSDSWGAGHELKRMPADWAWTISNCLMYMKPLTR